MENDKSIRHVSLLDKETLVRLFEPKTGRLESPIHNRSSLLVTNQRIIAFILQGDRDVTSAAFLKDLQGATIHSQSRNISYLFQGLALIIIGLMVYIALGTFGDNISITIPLLLGGAVSFMGLLFIGRFLILEQGGEIIFHMKGWDIRFPYSTKRLLPEIYDIIHVCFQLNSGDQVNDSCASTQPKVEHIVTDDNESTHPIINRGSCNPPVDFVADRPSEKPYSNDTSTH